MQFKISQTLEYSVIFEDPKPNPVTLLIGIPSNDLLEVFAWISSEIHGREEDSSFQFDLLKRFTGRFPDTIKEKLLNFVYKSYKEGKSFNVFNSVTNLSIIQLVLTNFNAATSNGQSGFTVDEEVNIFKAYLLLNEDWTSRVNAYHPNIGAANGKQNFLQFFMPLQICNAEYFRNKSFIVQYTIATKFFNFLEVDCFFKPLYKAFLISEGVNHWREYFKLLFSVIIDGLGGINGQPTIKLHVSNQFAQVQSWLNQKCVNPQTFKSHDDFLGLRHAPVFQLSSNDYLFLDHNFFIDKIFQGIVFSLSEAAKKQEVVLGGQKIKSFLDLKPLYSDRFSEKVLFYNVLEDMYSRKNSICFNGIELDAKVGDGATDYYVKDGDNVILIEFKDVLFAAPAKRSNDYGQIYNELTLKMVENQKGKAKGVTQLVNVIEDISNGKYSFNIHKPNKSKIYPVIVFTDYTFSLLGVNYILNDLFKAQINSKTLNIKMIHDLTLIHLDTLIEFQDLFETKVLNLRDCIIEYHKYIMVQKAKNVNAYMKQFTSFDVFLREKISLDKKIDPRKYVVPKIFREEMYKLID